MLDKNVLSLYVWGDLACFARPDINAERISYEVPTAAACRGILESVFWKPEFRWFVRSVEVLRPIRTVALHPPFAKKVDRSKGAAGQEDAVSRKGKRTIALKDVCYKISASVYQANGFDPKNPPPKYRQMFKVQTVKQRFHRQPCFGSAEFPAFFSLETPQGLESELPEDRDLGNMLLDVVHRDGKRYPHFFDAVLRNGVVEYPEDKLLEFWRESLAAVPVK